jgi:ABC-2 type transport system permease protein
MSGGRLVDDWRAVRVVWKRELIRFIRTPVRIAASLAQPILFLFVLGTGLSSMAGTQTLGNVDFRTFMYPGILAMTVLFTSIFSAISVVWDREFGFLREMLVAPVRRGSIVLGKCLGGATVATLQGTILLLVAPLVHVPLSPALIITLLFEMMLLATALTAFGLALASRTHRMETFQVVINFVALPLFFLSGALFPLNGLPTWLSLLTKLNPMSYAVDPMRRAVFSALNVPSAVKAQMNPGMTWGDWRVPTLVELAIVAAFGAVMLLVAIRQFSRTE